MKKMLVILYILTCFVIISIILAANMVYKDNTVQYEPYVRDYTKEESMPVVNMPEIVYIKAEYGRIAIYRQDGSLYDRTEINLSNLPISEQAKILNGLTLNIPELYDFLETYTS